MALNSNEKARQAALAKRQRIDEARASVSKLTDEECQLVYLEIEARLTRSMEDLGSRDPRIGGIATKANAMVAAPKPTFVDLILKLLDEERDGLRACEIAEKIKQSISGTFSCLRWLETNNRVARHGKWADTQWTLPDVVPSPRVDTIPNAVVDVLSKAIGPVDSRVLRDEVARALARIGKNPPDASLSQAIGRLISRGVVTLQGANEHGPLYTLAQRGMPDLN